MFRTLSAYALGLTVVAGAPAFGAAGTQASDFDAKLAAIFQSAYSLDHEEALTAARSIVASFPNESRAHRSLASVLWFEIIFRRGAVTIDHYLGGITKARLAGPKPPPLLDAEFKQALVRAIELAERRVEGNAGDMDARYDLGAAYGLQASYSASVEGSMTSAFASARRAFDAQEEVLSRDPRRIGAGVVVGTYRYVVAGLTLPSRMIAYMVGFGGDKEKGISLLEAATRDRQAHVEAKTALALIYTRERRHLDAMRLLGELAAEFPRNRLFVLEHGTAAVRAGKNLEADDILTRGLAETDRDPRPKIPGERALWLYKRGLARFNQNRRPEAAADFNTALQHYPMDWVRGRIDLALGQIADLEGRRNDAIALYRNARDAGVKFNDPGSAAEASRFMREPFTRKP